MDAHPALDAIELLHFLKCGRHPRRQVLDVHVLLIARIGLWLERRHVDLLKTLSQEHLVAMSSLATDMASALTAWLASSSMQVPCLAPADLLFPVDESLLQADAHLVSGARGARRQVCVLVGVEVAALRKGQPFEVHCLAP